MGPTCPHCNALYEWCRGEIEETVNSPKIYFCQECHEMFVLTADEVTDLQEKLRPHLAD